MKRISLTLLCIILVITLLPASASAEIKGETKLIALTFDDGPGPYTEELLDALKDRGAKATFFVLGRKVSTYSDTIRRAYDEGHQIGNHSWDHAKLTGLSSAGVKKEIDSTNNSLRKVLGDGITFCVRPPYGASNKTVLANLGAPGVHWSVDSNDWRWTDDADKTVSEILKNSFNGAIILLHDTHSWSVRAAVKVVDVLQAEGYEFVTVSELFRRRGETMQAGIMYRSKVPGNVNLPAISAPVFELFESEGKKCVSIKSDPGVSIRYEYGNKAIGPASAVYTDPLPFEGGLELSAAACIDNNGSRSDTVHLYINEKGNCFADVTPSDWYYESTDYFVSEGITDGVGNYRMAPQAPLSRGMLVTMLYRLAGRPEPQKLMTFTDVGQGFWYSDAVAWASEQGIVTGFPDGSFRPDDNVSREDMACIVYRGDKSAEGAKLTDKNALLDYPDYAQVCDYAAEAVRWALANDFLVTENGTISPQADASRAVILEMLYRHIRQKH